MKLLILSTEFPPGPGGIGNHACSLARELTKRRWVVEVVTPQDYAKEWEIAYWNSTLPFGVRRLRHLPNRMSEGLYRSLVFLQEYRSFRPDVCLATGAQSVWVCSFVSHFVPFRWLAVAHGSEFGAAGSTANQICKWAFRKANIVIFVSNYTLQYADRLGIHPRQYVVITNGADSTRFFPDEQRGFAFRRQLGLERAMILLTVGSVTERKGQDIVIRALPKVLAEFPNTHYLVAGIPRRQEFLERLARQLGVQERVHFLGRVDDNTLFDLYNACDIFVLTSRQTADGDVEGYGIAVVESALCGKPAVVSDHSGLAEAISPNETGLLVPQEDVSATSEAIISLCRDESLRRRMGLKALERAIREQTWASRAVRYEEVLRAVIEGSNK